MLYTYSMEEQGTEEQEEVYLGKDETDEVRLMKTTPNFRNNTETREEHSEEGGATMPVQTKKARSNMDVAGKIGHHEEECQKKKCESTSTSWQLTNYATNYDYDDHGMNIMRHRENSMSASTSTSASGLEDISFVDSGASNHMTSHQEWF